MMNYQKSTLSHLCKQDLYNSCILVINMKKTKINGHINPIGVEVAYGSEHDFQKIKPKPYACYLDENMEGICFDENLNQFIITETQRLIKKIE